MKTPLVFLLAALVNSSALAQTNSTNALELRTWIFQKGGKFIGKAVDFQGTNLIVLSTNLLSRYSLPLFQLSKQDQTNALLARHGILLSKYNSAGFLEFTAKDINAYPEKYRHEKVWIECRFLDMDSIGVSYKDQEIGLEIRDKNGDNFRYLRAYKSDEDMVLYGFHIKHVKLDDKVMALKKNTFIIIEGVAGNQEEPEVEITDIQIIPFNPFLERE